MKPEQRSYITGVGYIRIDSIERVELDQLTDANAMLDGFSMADALRAELCGLYGTDTLKKLTPYIIRFSVYPPSEQQAIIEEKKRKTLGEKTRCKKYRYFDF